MLVKEFKNLSLKAPACHPGVEMLCADFSLDADVSHLFEYINAVVKGAKYYKDPHQIIFDFEGANYSLFSDKVTGAPFNDRDQAVQKINSLIGFLNDLESRSSSITPDDSTYQPPVAVIEIFKLLPKTNCKKCDFATCMAFAAALSKSEVELSVCPEIMNDDDKLRCFKELGF